jgi:signal transduction histidine kinase/HAMP domain-containing protein
MPRAGSPMSSRKREVAATIAVATATAIRLFAPASSLVTVVAIAVLVLALFAIVIGRNAPARTAALFLALVAIVDLSTVAVAESVSRSFPTRFGEHLQSEVSRLRREVVTTEAELDASGSRLAAKLAATKGDPRRGRLFAMLRDELRLRPGRGARLVATNGEIVAWWGEELRVSGMASYQFDVTNLYILRSRRTATPQPMVIETFERIINRAPHDHSLFDSDDDWLSGYVYHGGALRQRPGSQRHLIERRPDAALWIDVIPRSRTEVVDNVRADGRTLASLLLAIGALAVLAQLRRTSSRWWPLFASAMVVLARVALLPIAVDEDPSHLFRFDIYGSKLLGPFSKSPIDLLLTAAALLVVVYLINSRLVTSGRAALIARAAFAFAAAYGYLVLVANLVDNSRISSIPDHIFPVSAAQGVLLSALLLFALTLLHLAKHAAPIGRTSAIIGIGVVATLAFASQLDQTHGIALVNIAAAVASAFIICALTPRMPLRLLIMALLTVLVVYVPVQLFERESARTFISDTYAPLVVGEAGQLRTMIEDTLQNEFTQIDLSTVLPDEYRRMSLDDLAYALWLRSDLPKWRVPAVITISDILDHPISRFGVGLPQFSERRSGEREILQVGSLTRELLHHDFSLSAYGMTIAEGSVHVVNPADPGATTFGDVYRDFFDASADDSNISLHAQREPIVYERNGNVHGSATPLRLPQAPAWYFASLKPGQGTWVEAARDGSAIYLRRADDALYAFPLDVGTRAQNVRRAGGVAIWAIGFVLLAVAIRSLPFLTALLRRAPGNLDFRTRTSLYLTAVVILPLVIFVLFVRAYLANRLEFEYVERGQTALNAAQRVVEDYLASSTVTKPEQVLDDDVLSWLARVIGHDLHLYHGEELVASSRRDLFAAHVESERLPGDVYAAIVLHGRQMFRAQRVSGAAQYIEIYSPINLAEGESYTLALPFIVQGRQIETQVNDLATTIYLLLVFIVIGSIAVAFRAARGVTTPVQGLVAGARAVAAGDFDYQIRVPSDPDLGLLVTTFRDMAKSIHRQQNDLRHERDRLQILLENINAAVVVLDGTMHVAATNLASRRLLGFDDSPLPKRFDPPFEELREFVARHRNRLTQSEEIELVVDGNPRTYRVSIVPLPESDEEMLIAEDVTEILRSNRLEAWGEMARQVAHEIKNPLTPIQLTAEHLRAMAERDDPNLPAVVRSAVDNILRQVVVLRETSKEFSDYASLRQVHRRPLDLKKLLEQLAADYSGSSERGIVFRADIAPSTPSQFAGDARLIRGAIANLIENAFQAAPGGNVRLASESFDSRVRISVEDSGPGVAPELLPKIFDPYFSTKSTGTGLGLAIARKAIEEHGGAVHAENLESGFRISVELPLK